MIEVYKDMTLQAIVRATIACTVQIRGRIFVADTGKIEDLNRSYLVDGVAHGGVTYVITGAANTIVVDQIPKGKVIDLVISTTTAGVQRCQLYVSAGLLKDNADTKPYVSLIPGGHVTTAKNIDIASPFEDSLSGRGFLTVINPANPPLGAPLSYAPNYNLVQLLNSVAFRYEASANVANRKPFVSIVDNVEAVLLNVGAANTVTAASAEKLYSFSKVSNARTFTDPNGDGTGNPYVIVLEELAQDVLLYTSDNLLRVGAENMDTDDQISEIAFYVEQWIKA